MSNVNDWISPERLRAIAAHLEPFGQPDLTLIAGDLRRFAAFTEDVEGAKKRKLEMQANMPESRAAMFQRTIAFHQGQAIGLGKRVQYLELVLRELIPMLNEPGKILAKKALESEALHALISAGALPERAAFCSRDDGHGGPCNGYPRASCPQG